MAEESVPVVRLGDRIPGPVRELGVDENDANAAVLLVAVAPHVPVPARIAAGAPGLDEPGMLIRGVIQHELDDHAQAARVRFLQERLEFLQRAIARVDARVVRDVIPVVTERRGIHRLDPEAVDAESRKMVELGRQPDEVADAVAIAVGERLDMELIEDGVFVPQRICGPGNRHGVFYSETGPGQ